MKVAPLLPCFFPFQRNCTHRLQLQGPLDLSCYNSQALEYHPVGRHGGDSGRNVGTATTVGWAMFCEYGVREGEVSSVGTRAP